MSETTPSPLNNVIRIDDERIRTHLDWVAHSLDLRAKSNPRSAHIY